ncbi:molybdopterin-dependent oxidoreductase [Altererythrobacter sp.]|uniref:molybdopterin-containing oxidoreductase family protein n=1 Tax=Altererythrobacter sp. TaxID=1872480 RepID=UPI001B056163|nr:molybdopterin-dependent oxidoreductase [Altererythrobacter sp.]MBO6610030.1 molybdopterin-dependent oxidoreductase [Altererythrobacter sp.]MBO6642140.1 molybdopterin-dependent oxidoreductase [Altererythrobacter sp.]MBO6709352.1 molybdopterin-dependent oxidoreductase [Altererythrobacter sp.]
MGVQAHKTYCRFCHANCAMLVDIEDGKVKAVRGDPDDPEYGGYTCKKGRELPDSHNSEDRLHHSLVRDADGNFQETPMPQALAHVSSELKRIIDKYGPDSVAVFMGSGGYQNSSAWAMSHSFAQAVGSKHFFTSVTLDQPAKVFTTERYGKWEGGVNNFSQADVALFIGNNPIVSHYAPVGGVPPFSPSKRIRDRKKEGLKLIVADPRLAEVGQLADIYLPVKPGEDPALLAGMLNVIINEELYDRNFVSAHVDGFEELAEAVQAFPPDVAAERAGVEKDELVRAARMFAGGSKGCAVTGTGPEMAGNGTLTEYLVTCLNTICARFKQEGEKCGVPGVFTIQMGKKRAQVAPPAPMFGVEGMAKSRFRGLGQLLMEMPCNVMADEILTPGEGQIRALISVGGNPEVGFPNQLKMRKALDDLELFVQIDPWMSASAKRADVVLAPSQCLEREDITNLSEWWHETAYARYTEALATPPGDVIDEYEMFWHLAKNLGLQLQLAGGPVPMDGDSPPPKETVLDLMVAGCIVPPSQVRKDVQANGGAAVIYDDLHPVIEPADADEHNRFQLAAGDMPKHLEKYGADEARAAGFDFRLISRRSKGRFNSIGQPLKNLGKKVTTNPAYIHPDDMAARGLKDGDVIEIASAHASIHGVAKGSDRVRRGLISMAHAFGDSEAGKHNVHEMGGSTNRLTSEEVDYDPITGQALQSAIPVRIEAA